MLREGTVKSFSSCQTKQFRHANVFTIFAFIYLYIKEVECFTTGMNQHRLSKLPVLKFATESETPAVSTLVKKRRKKASGAKITVDKGNSGIVRNIDRNPPWLQDQNIENKELLRAQAKYNLQILNSALERHADFCKNSGTFTREDIEVVMDAVFVASKRDMRLILGASDFLTLLLNMEEYNADDNDSDDSFDKFTVMTRDTLVASAFHYTDCVLAREAGIYEAVESMMKSTTSEHVQGGRTRRENPILALDFDSPVEELSLDSDDSVTLDVSTDDVKDTPNSLSLVSKKNDRRKQDKNRSVITKTGIEDFDVEAVKISQSTAKVKQVEIMTHALKPSRIKKASPNLADSASLRGLLLSFTDDWRALAIRSSACLYRLRGLLYHQRSISSSFYGLSSISNYQEAPLDTSQAIREAREAFYVYAPLAERLGMHRLKAELENTAFQILYRRQYKAATTLYAKSGVAIQSVTEYLRDCIELILKKDPWLAPQLKSLTITSRVKKPYSLWRKLLKKSKDLKEESPEGGVKFTSLSLFNPDTLSVRSVQDAIAMRIIIAAKENDDDSNNDRRSREEFLCYYIQNKLLQVWPAIDDSRVKDYISNPKGNGYQCLHHTSQCYRYGNFWPFEVQVRSEDMHIKNEFGVAAHWSYKLNSIGNKNQYLLPGQSSKKSTSDSRLSIPTSLSNEVETNSLLDGADTIDITGLLDSVEDIEFGSLNHALLTEHHIKALQQAREHLMENSVFVFYLSSNSAVEGKVMGLKKGSTVADAIIEICTRCGLNVPNSVIDSNLDVYVNGALANLHAYLKSGDTLIIPGLGKRVEKFM